jgi:hypothetical protein
MPAIEVFVDRNSNNNKLFYGKSKSRLTFDSHIHVMDVKNRDQLISQALSIAPEGSYILCAFGHLKTTLNASQIYDALEFSIKEIDPDIFYLTIYADNCSFNSDEYSYENSTIHRTISPHGTECILISPKGAEKIIKNITGSDGRGYDYYLNNLAEKMKFYTSYPPLLMVDVSKRDSDTALIKTTVCRENINLERPIELQKRYCGNFNIFWFFIIVIFIIFIAGLAVNYGNVYNRNEEKIVVKKVPNVSNVSNVPIGEQDPTGQLTSIDRNGDY